MKKKTIPRKPQEPSGYIQRASIPVWLSLTVLVLLLTISTLLLFTTGLTQRMIAAAFCEDGEMYVYIGKDDCEVVEKGMVLEIENNIFYVTDIEPSDEAFTNEEHSYISEWSRVEPGEQLYSFRLDTDMADGIYVANIQTGESLGEVIWELLTE